MNNAAVSPSAAAGTPLPEHGRLITAIGHGSRWKMLKELCAGEPRSISELAGAAGCSYEGARKHLAVLVEAGLIVQGRGRLYQIPKQYLPTPGQAVVDFGHCVLRLDKAG